MTDEEKPVCSKCRGKGKLVRSTRGGGFSIKCCPKCNKHGQRGDLRELVKAMAGNTEEP